MIRHTQTEDSIMFLWSTRESPVVTIRKMVFDGNRAEVTTVGRIFRNQSTYQLIDRQHRLVNRITM